MIKNESTKLFEKKKVLHIFLNGRPNAGKGTISRELENIYGKDNIFFVSSGDYFRDCVAKAKGKAPYYASTMNKGFLVEDVLVSDYLNKELENISRSMNNVDTYVIVYDGVPRNRKQASWFVQSSIYNTMNTTIVSLPASEETCLERSVLRVVCGECSFPQIDLKRKGVMSEDEVQLCDKCGADSLIRRSDDADLQIMKNRLKIYREYTSQAFDVMQNKFSNRTCGEKDSKADFVIGLHKKFGAIAK